MVSTSQIGIGTTLRSSYTPISTDSVSALSSHLDGQTTASPVLGASDLPGGLFSWMSLLQVSSLWEAALIVVLFLLIGGLVGVRLAETVSNRTVDIATDAPVSATAADPAATGERATESTPTNSSPTETQSYDQYFEPDTPSKLLSDEGLVVRLLIANHGRIRQHRIAEETGWSKSKVSRICSQMHDDGMIEKTSAGRENVIILSDRSPDETESDDVENPVP
ncbi:hypothetical protein C495_11559 [Natronorubrum sulfidifaciens JCM 14089]|uniref:DUF7343 domain-containing protein n=2 Tax=Natronorubrum sulfidifaciens TaxID=388259 RepID=L9W519_9EURY|nr:hypothetical protein C495_11559 [Natronorubrum sulfidifaciens JCM 14089]